MGCGTHPAFHERPPRLGHPRRASTGVAPFVSEVAHREQGVGEVRKWVRWNWTERGGRCPMVDRAVWKVRCGHSEDETRYHTKPNLARWW